MKSWMRQLAIDVRDVSIFLYDTVAALGAFILKTWNALLSDPIVAMFFVYLILFIVVAVLA